MKCFRLVLTLMVLCLTFGCGSEEKQQAETKSAKSKDTATTASGATPQPATTAQTPASVPAPADVTASAPGQTSTANGPVAGAQKSAPDSLGTTTSPDAATKPSTPGSAPATAPASVSPASSASGPQSQANLATPSLPTTAKSKNPPATPFVSSVSKEISPTFGIDAQAKAPARPAVPAAVATASQFGVQTPAQAPAAQHPPAQPAQTAAPAPQAAVPVKQEPKKTEAAKAPAVPPAQPAPAPQAAAQSGGQSGNVSLASLAKTNKIEVIQRSPDKPPHPKSGDASQKFITFCEKWLQTLNKSYINTVNNVELLNKDGKFVARYTAIDMNSVRIEIKESAYDHTPFVGLLRYSEQQLEAEGASPQEAKTGKFNVAKRIGVTEIFRYTKDNWVE